MAGEGAVSEPHTVPVTPDVTAGPCEDKRNLQSHSVFSQHTFPPGYFVVPSAISRTYLYRELYFCLKQLVVAE